MVVGHMKSDRNGPVRNEKRDLKENGHTLAPLTSAQLANHCVK